MQCRPASGRLLCPTGAAKVWSSHSHSHFNLCVSLQDGVWDNWKLGDFNDEILSQPYVGSVASADSQAVAEKFMKRNLEIAYSNFGSQVRIPLRSPPAVTTCRRHSPSP